MNKKILFGVAAMGLLGMVGAGVGLSNLRPAIEAQADEPIRDHAGYTAGDTIYLQLKDAWKEGGAKFAFYFFQSTNKSNNKWSPILSTKTIDAYYKFVLTEDFALEYDTVIAVRLNPSAETARWNAYDDENYVWGQTNDLEAGSSTNCIWLPNTVTKGGGWMIYNENRYTLHIGAKNVPMELNPDNEYQVYGTINGASSGDWVAVALNDDDPGDIHSDGKYSNNIDAGNHLKVGGSITVYMYRDSWTSWVTGYAPDGSIPLQNFCDELLGNSISDGVCSLNSGSWNALKDRWNKAVTGDNAGDYNLSDADRTAFTAAVAKDGNGQSYDSVVQEAKTRYLWMVRNKGAEDFAGFLTAAKETAPLTEGGKGALAASIIVGCSAIALGGLFLLRKKSAE